MFLIQFNFETIPGKDPEDIPKQYHTNMVLDTYKGAEYYIKNEFPYRTCKLLDYSINELDVVESENPDFYLLHYDYYTYNLLGKRLFVHCDVVFLNLKMLLNFVTKICKNVIRYNYEKVKIKKVN